VAELRARAALETDFAKAIGRVGMFRQLGLPSWYDVPAVVSRMPSNARDHSLQSQTGETRRGSIRHALGFTRDEGEAVVPTCIGDVTIDENLVTKLLNKTDSGHNQLLQFGIATLREPLEVWEDGGKVRFLRLYRIGTEAAPATQIAVVDRLHGFPNTVYEIDDSKSQDGGRPRDSIEERTNRKRRGTCLFIGY
jgi:hypothetical protein